MMYFVALTLQGEEAEYENLVEAIKALGAWSNRLQGVWLVQSSLSARQIRDLLKLHIKAGDRLFVGQFERNWAGTGMGEGFPEWLNRRAFAPGETEVPAPQQEAAQ